MDFLRRNRTLALRVAVGAIVVGSALALTGTGGGRIVGLLGFLLAGVVIGDGPPPDAGA